MRGLLLLFLTIVFGGIGWSYCSKESQHAVVKLIKRHLFSLVFAFVAVAVVIVISVNTTLRLV